MLTYESAGAGEGIVLSDERDGVSKTSFPYKRYIARDIHMGGAECHAGNGLGCHAGAALMSDMLFIVLTAVEHALKHHACRFIAYGAVCRLHDGSGSILNDIDGSVISLAVKYRCEELVELHKPDAAGRTLSAGLGMAHLHEYPCDIYRAESRRARHYPLLEVLVDRLDHKLRLTRRKYLKSAHKKITSDNTLRGNIPAFR